MRMCTEEEAAAYPVSDNQVCAIGAGTTSYRVIFFRFNMKIHGSTCHDIQFKHPFSSQGDSGGPISLKSGDQHVQVGDVSFGPSCIAPGYTVSPKMIQ